MQTSELGEDLSFILYLVPIPLYSIYAIIISFSGPNVFFNTLGSPILFGVAVSSVVGAIVSEVSTSESPITSILRQNSKRLQLLSVSWFVWLLLFAASTGGLGLILANFGYVNFGILFPFSLMAVSFAFASQVIRKLQSLSREVIPVLLIVTSPIVLYLLWRANAQSIVIGIASLLFLFAGILLVVFLPKIFVSTAPAVQMMKSSSEVH
ncbi:MAG: hypothetical protein ACE5KG_05855 [Nitrososphaerales archaeon]